MKVYILEHDEGNYNWDEMWTRGVFLSRQDAEAAITTSVNPGNVERHSDQCCEVSEWEVTMPQRVFV